VQAFVAGFDFGRPGHADPNRKGRTRGTSECGLIRHGGGRVQAAVAARGSIQTPDRRRGRDDLAVDHVVNAAYAAGSLLLAALIGGAAQSGAVFVFALAALLTLDLVAGNIRPKRR
jgi:hypothetical protein